MSTVTGSAATGDHDAAGAWRQALLSTPSSADVTLARADLQSWDDLLSPETGPADLEVLGHMRQVLGIGGSRTALPARPAPSTAAQQMGIY
jgi:hypothetical protein